MGRGHRGRRSRRSQSGKPVALSHSRFRSAAVAMDSHGGSLYDAVDGEARDQRAAVLATLGVKRCRCHRYCRAALKRMRAALNARRSRPTYSFSAPAARAVRRAARHGATRRCRSPSRSRDCSANAAARAWSRAATTSRSRPAIRSSATSWTRSRAARGCPTRTSRGRWSTGAIERIHELENELGCFFDRNPDGTIHQKAFAGQTFDRTVHKGDLTGIEIINRLAEQVWARGIRGLEEHRALGVHSSRRRRCASPACCWSTCAAASTVSWRRQGGAARHRRRPDDVPLSHASGDKSCDGLAMALARGPAAARHGDGAVPSDGPACRRAYADDRHGARRGLARRRRLSARRRGRALHAALRSARRARDARHRLARHLRRNARRPHDAERRRLAVDGASRSRQRAPAVQGHGRALRRLRLRSRGRPRRGRADRALHDGRRRVRAPTARRRCADCSSPARIRAACTAPIGSAATAWPIRRCSAPSPATRWRRGSRARARCASPTPAPSTRRSRGPRRRSARRGKRPRRHPRTAVRDDVGRRGHRARCARASRAPIACWPRSRRSSTRRAARRCARPRFQPDLARLAQPAQPGRGKPRDRARRAGAREFAGAHYRADFPRAAAPAQAAFTRVQQVPAPGEGSTLGCERTPVRFTRVRPG